MQLPISDCFPYHVSKRYSRWASADTTPGRPFRQVLEAGPSQLAAAVVALVSTLVARAKDSTGLLWLAWQASFAHWALEACVIAEAERLTGEVVRHRRYTVCA
jgi:hypothetical protein